MMDEIRVKRFTKAMMPAIMNYRPGSTIIYDTVYEFIKKDFELSVSFNGALEELAELLNVKKLDDDVLEVINKLAKKFETEAISNIEKAIKEKSK